MGLFGWNAIDTFTQPSRQSAAHELGALVETVTGEHTTRIAMTETGAALILIDGPENGMSAASAGKIRQIVSTLSPDAPAPIIRQYPFVDGQFSRPDYTALIELGLLGLLAAIAAWFAFSERQIETPDGAGIVEARGGTAPPVLKADAKIEPVAERAWPTLSTPPPPGLTKAIDLARANPKKTANLIRQWMHQDQHTQ